MVKVVHYSTVILKLIGPTPLPPLSSDFFTQSDSVHSPCDNSYQLRGRLLGWGSVLVLENNQTGYWTVYFYHYYYGTYWQVATTFWFKWPVLPLTYNFSLYIGHSRSSYLSYIPTIYIAGHFLVIFLFVGTEVHMNAHLPSFSYSGSPLLDILMYYLFIEKC